MPWNSIGPCSADALTILEAVDSGDPSAVETVVSIIGKEQATNELSALRTNDSRQLETVIMLAARDGDVEMFHAVLRSLRQTLTKKEVGSVGKSALSVAVTARGLRRGRLN